MSQRIVYFNGEFVPESQARVSIYDSALTMGDMAFEVTRTVHGRPFRLDDHLARLYHTLDALRIDCGLSVAEMRAITEVTLARNLPTEPAEVDWNVIHNVSRGPTAANFAALRRGNATDRDRELLFAGGKARLAGRCLRDRHRRRGAGTALDSRRPARRFAENRSRLHYQLANLQANEMRPGAWAILTDPAGHLTEGTSGNVFLVRHGMLMTPKAENLLPGITRQMVLELAVGAKIRVLESDLTPADAAEADEMFMTSTSIGILHVRNFAGRVIGAGGIGPITARLRASLCDAVGLDFAAQAARYAELRCGRR